MDVSFVFWAYDLSLLTSSNKGSRGESHNVLLSVIKRNRVKEERVNMLSLISRKPRVEDDLFEEDLLKNTHIRHILPPDGLRALETCEKRA